MLKVCVNRVLCEAMCNNVTSADVNKPLHDEESEPTMMKIRFANTVKALGLLCLLLSTLAHADTKLEDFSVMATGPLDGRAVVKSADGKMLVLKVGDTLPGTQATVLQVLADKLVVEESVGKEGQPKVKQTAWMLKASKPGEATSVQRFDTQGPAPVRHEVAVMKPLSPVKGKVTAKATATPKAKAKPKAKSKAKTKAKAKTKDEVKPDAKKEVK